MSCADAAFTRRNFLNSFGSVGIGLLANPVFAEESEERTSFTPPGVKRDLPEDVFSKPRAIFKQHGQFELDDPAQLGRARLKSIFSLDGSKSYVLRVSRSLICPPGKPSQTLLNEMQFWYSFMEVADVDQQSGEPSSVIRHSLFTRVAVDPVTFKPQRQLKILETGKVHGRAETLG